MHIVVSSVYCLEMHMLCTSHFYSYYLHMYMSSAYYLRICVLCAHYLQWSLTCSFLTDNVNIIHMSSLVLFIYPIMYNLVFTHCLHKHTLSMSPVYCLQMYMLFTSHVHYSYQASRMLYLFHNYVSFLSCVVFKSALCQGQVISAFNVLSCTCREMPQMNMEVLNGEGVGFLLSSHVTSLAQAWLFKGGM